MPPAAPFRPTTATGIFGSTFCRSGNGSTRTTPRKGDHLGGLRLVEPGTSTVSPARPAGTRCPPPNCGDETGINSYRAVGDVSYEGVRLPEILRCRTTTGPSGWPSPPLAWEWE